MCVEYRLCYKLPSGMTLVAAFLLGNIPIVMGDMLISGEERTDTEIGIPTVDAVTEVFPAGSGYSIVGMQQKVVVLSDDLALAWAGNVIAARTLVAELSSLIRTGGITLASLNTFLLNDAPGIVGDLKASLVGVFRNSDGIRLFGYNAVNIAAPGFQDIAIAGVGVDAFAQLLLDLPPSYEAIRGTPNALGEAVLKTLLLTGLLLHLEIGTRENLRTFYGGGYELASLIRGRFSKIDDVTYVFWSADVRSEGVWLNMPHAYLKFAYKDDALLIRSLRTKPNPKTGRQTLDESLHVVPNYSGLAREWTINDQPSMNSRFVCNYIFVDSRGHKLAVRCHVDFEPTGSRIVRFDESGEKPIALFDKVFLDQLMKSISAEFNKSS
jgi:hypothetical protein